MKGDTTFDLDCTYWSIDILLGNQSRQILHPADAVRNCVRASAEVQRVLCIPLELVDIVLDLHCPLAELDGHLHISFQAVHHIRLEAQSGVVQRRCRDDALVPRLVDGLNECEEALGGLVESRRGILDRVFDVAQSLGHRIPDRRRGVAGSVLGLLETRCDAFEIHE